MRFELRISALICVLMLVAFPSVAQEPQSSATPPNVSHTAAPARTILIHAKNFEFDPSEITLKKDQTVKLELTSDDVRHSLVVRGLGINSIMNKGEMTEVVVTPEKTGDFPGTCGVYCGKGHNDMRFIVHVVN